MLGPIDQPQFAFCDRNNRPVARVCRWPAQQSASTVCRLHPAHQCTDRCCCVALLHVPLRERQDAAAAQQRLRQDVHVDVHRDGLTSSRTHRRADALSMARCASTEKMPVVPAISSSVFEDSKALQPLRLPAVASGQRRHALGLASLVCGVAVTRERQRSKRRLSEKVRFAVCEAP